MRTRYMNVLFMATMVACSASMAAEQADIDPPAAVAAAAASGPDWIEVHGGQWPVPAPLLADMAGKLRDAEGSSTRVDFSKYIIQYQGKGADHGRHVRLFGMCDAGGMSRRALSAEFVMIFDGGKCYFDATYDPERGSFTDFDFHGR